MAKAIAMGGRMICCILDDVRSCHRTRNYSYLPGLIEELQYRANRMEDRLDRVSNYERLERRLTGLKAEIKELEAKKDKIGESDGK